MKRYVFILWAMMVLPFIPGLSTAQCNMPATPPSKPGLFSLMHESITACFVEDAIPGSMVFRLDIGKDGTIVNAVAEKSSGLPYLDTCITQNLCKLPKFSPATDEEGKPVASVYRFPLVICLKK